MNYVEQLTSKQTPFSMGSWTRKTVTPRHCFGKFQRSRARQLLLCLLGFLDVLLKLFVRDARDAQPTGGVGLTDTEFFKLGGSTPFILREVGFVLGLPPSILVSLCKHLSGFSLCSNLNLGASFLHFEGFVLLTDVQAQGFGFGVAE